MLFLLRPIAWVVFVSRICDGIEEEGFRVGFDSVQDIHRQWGRCVLRVHSQPWKETFPRCLCFPIKILNVIPKSPRTAYLVLWSRTHSRWKCCQTAVVEVPFPLQPLPLVRFLSLPPSCAVLLLLPLFSPSNQSTQNQCRLPVLFLLFQGTHLKIFCQNFKHDAVLRAWLLLCFVPCVFICCMDLLSLQN